MTINSRILTPLLSVLALVAFALPQKSEATIVEVRTVLGDFQINLYDNATPDRRELPRLREQRRIHGVRLFTDPSPALSCKAVAIVLI